MDILLDQDSDAPNRNVALIRPDELKHMTDRYFTLLQLDVPFDTSGKKGVINQDIKSIARWAYSPERVPRQLGFCRFLGTWKISERKKCARLSKVVCR